MKKSDSLDLVKVISSTLFNSFQITIYFIWIDPEGLKQQALQGARFGFTGKQAIHPGQVDIIQRIFSPDQEKVEWAEELLKAYENCSQVSRTKFNHYCTHHGKYTPKILNIVKSIQLTDWLSR